MQAARGDRGSYPPIRGPIEVLRTWLPIAVPVIFLVLVVIAGVLGGSAGPVGTPPPVEGAAVSAGSSPPHPTATSDEPARTSSLCAPSPMPFVAEGLDLTGAWQANDDGIYYLRQEGAELWWNGMSGREGPPNALGRDFNNVAHGEIDGVTIRLDWADVPRGGILGGGTLQLLIDEDSDGYVRLVNVGQTGSGFGALVWIHCEPG